MKNIKLKDLAIEHDYYCSEVPGYGSSNEDFNTWSEFYNEYNDCDIDQNLIFRWDIVARDEDNYYMHVFIIRQRKGIFAPIYISNVLEENVPQIIELLLRHKEKLDKIWKPL